MKGPDADKEIKALSTVMKDQDIQIKEQGSRFKLPKFGISLPEVRGPGVDVRLDKTQSSVPKAQKKTKNVEVQGNSFYFWSPEG